MKKTYYLITIWAALLITSCNTEHMDSKTFDYLALGDSYTIGESVDPKLRYPVQLADSLQIAGIKMDKVKIVAKTGWTTDELSGGIDTANLDEIYDLVTLLIGVNNQYRGRDLDNYREEFIQLLSRAIAFAGDNPKNVIVISIPDWGVTPFAEGRDTAQIAKEIDNYNAVKLEESNKVGVHFVNVTEISRQAAIQENLIATDGLHPSGLMYTEWVKEILPIAKQILAENE